MNYNEHTKYGDDINIAVVGDGLSGKSTLVKMLTAFYFGNVQNEAPGVFKGSLKQERCYIPESRLNKQEFRIWDTLVCERYPGDISGHIAEKDAVIIVYDVRNRQSFNEIFLWFSDIRRLSPRMPVAIVGTKKDLSSLDNYVFGKFSDRALVQFFEVSRGDRESSMEPMKFIYRALHKRTIPLTEYMDRL